MNTIDNILPNASDAMKKLNPGLFEVPIVRESGRIDWGTIEKSPKIIRQRTKAKLNKTEEAFEAYLKRDKDVLIYSQEITFVLANGARFTPDFVTTDKAGEDWTAYDVKGVGGRIEDDAVVKIKLAANKYTKIRWLLAWPKDRFICDWNFQLVKA